MTDIFTNETIVEPTLDAFVGEGKKYIDQNAVAKALVEKDAFIARLQDEARRKEADLTAALNTKAFEDRIKALEAVQLTERAAPPEREVTPPASATPDIEVVVQKALEDREAANNRSRNLINVKDKLTQVYGDDFPNRVKARALELNISLVKLNEMAAETPSAFYALIGLDTQRPVDNVTPPVNRQNTAAQAPTSGVKNNAYYTNLRKTNPSLYWTPKVQMEEYNELRRQGDAFGL